MFRFDGAMIASRDARAPGDARPDAGRSDAPTGPGTPGRPAVPVTYDVTTPTAIAMTAWNVLQSEVSWFEEIVVILRNDTSAPICQITFDVYLESATGTTLGRIGGTVDGEPLEEFGFAMPCIRPGQSGIGYGNASALTPLDRVTRLRLTYRGTSYPTARSFATVLLDRVAVVDPIAPSSFRALDGHYTVLTGGVINPSVRIVPRDPVGLPLEHLTGPVLGTFTAGWDFQTTWAEFEFATYYQSIHFRNAASPLIRGEAVGPELAAMTTRQDEFDALRAETDARHAARDLRVLP